MWQLPMYIYLTKKLVCGNNRACQTALETHKTGPTKVTFLDLPHLLNCGGHETTSED